MKKVFTILIAVLLSLASSAQVEINGLYYNLDAEKKTAEVTKPSSGRYSGDIVIPSSVEYNSETYSVNELGHSFSYSDITSVVIPSSISEIGSYEFFGSSSLKNVTLSEGLKTIGIYAFDACSSLSSITIPSTVNNIRYGAFGRCDNLTTIIVNDNNTTYDSRNNCNAIIETSTNKLIVGCNATVIPNSVKGIGFYAFFGCEELTALHINSNINNISPGAFTVCRNLESITVDANNSYYYSDNCNAIFNNVGGNKNLVLGCKNTTIPNDLYSIGRYAFDGCTGLSSLYLPSSVKAIEDDAFKGCSGLNTIIVDPNNTSFDSRDNCNAIIETSTNKLLVGSNKTIIPNSVTAIGDCAFEERNIVKLIIPSSIKTIGKLALSMGSLKTLYVYCTTPPTLPTGVVEDVFSNVYHASLFVPEGCIDLYQNADQWNDNRRFSSISEIKSHETITIGSEGMRAYCSNYDLDFKGVTGLSAYIATGFDYENESLMLTEVDKVSSGTGVLLIGEEGNYEVPVNYNYDSRIYYENGFKGCVSETNVKKSSYTIHYFLTDGPQGFGFYENDEENVSVEANSCYLEGWKKSFSDNAGDAEEITMGSAGISTFWSEKVLNFKNSGLSAYTVTGYDRNTGSLLLSPVDIVPAKTGIIIKGNEGSYNIPSVSAKLRYETMLGWSEGEYFDGDEFYEYGSILYYLSNGEKGIGFYRIRGTKYIPYGKCVLFVNEYDLRAYSRGESKQTNDTLDSFSNMKVGNVKKINVLGSLNGNGTTGVHETKAIDSTIKDDVFYNLNGQKVDSPRKGIYILNGKKIVIR